MVTQSIAAYSAADFAAEVCAGLSKPGQKELPSKYLYDEVGSALFEVISLLPEYGLTRAGERLLRRHAEDIVERLPSPTIVAELGSGRGRMTRWLLQALSRRQRTTYYPIDLSRAALTQCERELRQIDSVSVVGFERAYLDGLLEVAARRQARPGQSRTARERVLGGQARPAQSGTAREGVLGGQAHEQLLVLFLGSTIGNFDRPAGEEFLRDVRGMLLPGDSLLLATDLEKPVPQLLLAYDDPIGVTAAFNLNLLARINRELEADFVPSRFEHVVFYDALERRIEMHLRSKADQIVHIPGANLEVSFRKGETIWTESCHKFTAEEVAGMAARTGFRCEAQWIDTEWPFAQSFFVAQ